MGAGRTRIARFPGAGPAGDEGPGPSGNSGWRDTRAATRSPREEGDGRGR